MSTSSEPRGEDPDALVMACFGEIVVCWSYVEQGLGAILGHLLEANPAMFHVVRNGVSSSAVTAWVRTLLQAHAHPGAAKQDDLDLLSTIDELRAERNALVHGLWQPGHEVGGWLVQTIRLERAEIIKQEVVTLPDLQELLVSIREAKDAIEAMGKRLGSPHFSA